MRIASCVNISGCAMSTSEEALPEYYRKIAELAKRRGFFWPSYEIYGGVAGFYELGPLGTRLKEKILALWRKFIIEDHREFVVEIETPIIGPAKVYEASGHLEHFRDPIVQCLSCKRKFRADHIIEEKININAEKLTAQEMTKIIHENNIKCPICGGELSEVTYFNLLFTTTIGPYREDVGFLRPETAQGIFTAFKRVYEVTRRKLPLGIAQVGRVARNEISPRQGIIRLREFTIAEMEFFFDPEDPSHGGLLEKLLDKVNSTKLRILRAEDKLRGEAKPQEYRVEEVINEKIILSPWLAYWMCIARDFMKKLGVAETYMYFDEKLPEERAHYSQQTFDQLVWTRGLGWIEVSGHAYRTDYDLSRHIEYSGKDLYVFKAYEKPLRKKKKVVVVDKGWLGRSYKERAKKILELLNKMDPRRVESILRGHGHLRIGDAIIPREKITIIEKEEVESGRRFIPYVVEPSFGVERLLYVSLEYAYTERDDKIVLSLPREIVPFEVAIFPLVKDDKLINIAKNIYKTLSLNGLSPIYDDDGSIGRRYARVDEIGVPLAITVDYQSLEDNTVTFRDRDTRRQVRVPIDEIVEKTVKFLKGEQLESLGVPY